MKSGPGPATTRTRDGVWVCAQRRPTPHLSLCRRFAPVTVQLRQVVSGGQQLPLHNVISQPAYQQVLALPGMDLPVRWLHDDIAPGMDLLPHLVLHLVCFHPFPDDEMDQGEAALIVDG